MAGEGKEEEEPEGELVAGPSGEAIVHSSGNALLCFTTPPFCSFNKSLTILYYILLWHTPSLLSGFPFCILLLPHILGQILITDESDEEGEVVITETKKEQELGVIHSWMEVGDLPALPEEEAWGLSCEVCSSSFFSISFNLFFLFFSLQSLHLSLMLLIDLPFSFQGLNLLRRARALQEEARQLEAEGL